MGDLDREILDFISKHPGSKARDIAHALGCDRVAINAALDRNLRKYCIQDSSYRWFMKEQYEYSSDSTNAILPDEKLSALCHYYLNCLSLEESNSISSYLLSGSHTNFTELSSLAINSSEPRIASLIRKFSESNKKLILHMGYPVSIFYEPTKNGNAPAPKIAPVFLFSVEIVGGAVTVSPIPRVNMAVIRQYSCKDINTQVYDLINLESELGLADSTADIELDELVARLQAIREWQWREHLDPSAIRTEPPVNTFSAEGIYNRAIFIASEKSPYTEGLETELLKLSHLPESAYRNTALHAWLHQTPITFNKKTIEDSPLLEVLPMNSEQRQAVLHALNNNLTVVTGPPGTGKSQVVTNLLINAAREHQSVLFSSKNNKAVDVVETRANSLGRRPLVLRIGNNRYASRLAELIEGLLSSFADQSEQHEYQILRKRYEECMSKHRALGKKKAHVIELRNNADRIEQQYCELRDTWKQRFQSTSKPEEEAFRNVFEEYKAAYDAWYKTKASFIGRILWFIVGRSKTTELYRCINQLHSYISKYPHSTMAINCYAHDAQQHETIMKKCQSIMHALLTINEYREALSMLASTPRLEEIDSEISLCKNDMARIAHKLWDLWLITQPLQIDAYSRREMLNFVSAMRLTNNGNIDNNEELKRKFLHLLQKMQEYISCWAVTSLSANKKVPFQAGYFDLVVIDEASQCDIASALPLLYRAKRAVIIGDPKQLTHISTIAGEQDFNLLQKHKVDIGWSYSAISLYSLASSLCDPTRIIHLRDHHRSFEDIIEFSNAEFYDGRLRVATKHTDLNCPPNITPGIHWVDTPGQTLRPVKGSAYNESEIATIIKVLNRLIVETGYEGQVGIVTPFREQADRINKAVMQNRTLYAQLQKNELLIDTVHKFQGDERDVMIFSPVISNGTEQSALTFLNKTGNLFNVAITRARAALIVVGDSNYCANCGVPFLEHFVTYVEQLQTKKKKEEQTHEQPSDERNYPNVSNPEAVSDWERYFYTAMYDHGIRTVPQYPVDKYRLDFALFDGERMLDIEIDGEWYHRDWDGELSYRDQLRNERLFELGWEVKRFWVYQIRDDLEGCIAQIKRWIKNCK